MKTFTKCIIWFAIQLVIAILSIIMISTLEGKGWELFFIILLIIAIVGMIITGCIMLWKK